MKVVLKCTTKQGISFELFVFINLLNKSLLGNRIVSQRFQNKTLCLMPLAKACGQFATGVEQLHLYYLVPSATYFYTCIALVRCTACKCNKPVKHV